MDETWDEDYKRCPVWNGAFHDITTGGTWPEGYVYDNGRLYFQGKLRIPSDRVVPVIQWHHYQVGHPGGERLWTEMGRW